MHRMIRNAGIFAQAISRQDALKRLNANSEEIAIHMAKCIVYGDDLRCLKHWLCSEIAGWIKLAAAVKLKGGKVKVSTYQDTVFGMLGDEKSDAYANLLDLQIRVDRHKLNYPRFDITDEMEEQMFVFSQKVRTEVSKLLVQNNGCKLDDKTIQNLLIDLYNKSVR